MLLLLVTAVSATMAIRSALQDQRYTDLASKAAEAGTVMATACLNQNGGQATWTNTDCSGTVISGLSAYVFEDASVRSYFTVQQPLTGAGNVPVSAAVKGYSEVLRTSSGTAWRVWSSDTAVALTTANDGNPAGTVIMGAWSSDSLVPAGYLLTSGQCVSQTTYANLYAVVGEAYAVSNVPCSSGEFRLPWTSGRNVISKQGTTGDFGTVGNKGGATTNTHNHYTLASFDGRSVFATVTTAAPRSQVVSANRAVLSVASTATGSTRQDSTLNETINTLDPYIVLYMAIKY